MLRECFRAEMTLCEYDFASATMHTQMGLINITLPEDHSQLEALARSKVKLASSELAKCKNASAKHKQFEFKDAMNIKRTMMCRINSNHNTN
jgi:hypothetical protein